MHNSVDNSVFRWITRRFRPFSTEKSPFLSSRSARRLVSSLYLLLCRAFMPFMPRPPFLRAPAQPPDYAPFRRAGQARFKAKKQLEKPPTAQNSEHPRKRLLFVRRYCIIKRVCFFAFLRKSAVFCGFMPYF